MLDRRDHGVEPTEPPMVEVDWREWWVAIDKRVQEHLAAERETLVKSLGKALAMERRRLRENADEFRGPPGRPGKDAKLPRVKIWGEDSVYYEGDCVAFNGSLFQAQCDTGKSPLFAKHWMCLATAGADGKPIRHRGEFGADVEYLRPRERQCQMFKQIILARVDQLHHCPTEWPSLKQPQCGSCAPYFAGSFNWPVVVEQVAAERIAIGLHKTVEGLARSFG